MNHDRFWTMLSRAAAAEIENASVARNWRSNAVIFRQGERCDGMHILQHGLVKLYVASMAGREQTISVQRASSVLTFVPLLDQGVYATSAATLTPSRTLFLPIEQFDAFVVTSAEFRQAVLSEAGRMLRGVISLADSIALKPVPARVALHILEEANRLNSGSTCSEFRFKMTQEELARLIGATRESVSRALAQLRAAGIIEQQGSRVRVLDPEALAEYGQSGAM